MTDQNGSALSLSIAAHEHLADAKLHLHRCLIAIRHAAQEQPQLVTKLGTVHAQLQDLRELLQERVR